MKDKEMICIVCPKGCNLKVIRDKKTDNGYKVYGNLCPRGVEYGIKEVTSPTRIITSTVKISEAHLRRLPVKTDKPIPKGKIKECMKVINSLEISAPVKAGDVLVENVLSTGSNIIATRSM
ncbi:DUF1667 domain-containing protein [Proteinivorax hydrogeniformans]|uniref:DUF1667 domain-containing protein n=1 Tax=Proteinivorax hydrogeniformans TaxID=1826727 RepID=A0AAU8HW22_9FIRM